MAGVEVSAADRAIDAQVRTAFDREPEVLNGILRRLRCGAPLRDVPEKYGNWNTIFWRFRRWSEAGIWEIVAVT